MAGGLAALLDDVAAITRAASASLDDVTAMAGRTSMKAAGVVVDDAAVTPQYVQGVNPSRELPMIWRIAKGSLVNKLVIILPLALLLSAFAPWALTPILMLGGSYLCFEGAEKIWHSIHKRIKGEGHSTHPKSQESPQSEDQLVKGAITTDLILSAEIMVISLNEVADQTVWMQAGVLIVVGIGITALVYGVVGMLVKMDDVGLALSKRDSSGVKAFGRGLVKAMPIVLQVISVVGVFAMLWVGGHIMVVGTEELGWELPYHLVHGLEEWAHNLGGSVLGWFGNTLGSLIFGLIWGALIVSVVSLVKGLTPKRTAV
ncbi:hypothetical protein CDES_05260 [Corynebacterium deserti GIMN1.010]|uniref:ABC transporter n=1 Tax=Corynebacterium deserti GIMN1.010 TaxID=931089 RepID=A0A0M3Q9D6_9CORY|nr:DUF808 domain-containing protein [Corynebacterium deserti]ALC05489.1 hypothetical protein CDES_05260 [Corynebacterium deserti GIMN1.010]